MHFRVKGPVSQDLEQELSIYAIKGFGEVNEGDVQVLALSSAFFHHSTQDECAINCASAVSVA